MSYSPRMEPLSYNQSPRGCPYLPCSTCVWPVSRDELILPVGIQFVVAPVRASAAIVDGAAPQVAARTFRIRGPARVMGTVIRLVIPAAVHASPLAEVLEVAVRAARIPRSIPFITAVGTPGTLAIIEPISSAVITLRITLSICAALHIAVIVALVEVEVPIIFTITGRLEISIRWALVAAVGPPESGPVLNEAPECGQYGKAPLMGS